jgi:hypothetical protein
LIILFLKESKMRDGKKSVSLLKKYNSSSY